mgnify:FL=1|jgi:hypothetical protein
MEKKKNPKETKFRKATPEEWRKLGLPESTTTIHFGKPPWANKQKEIKKK